MLKPILDNQFRANPAFQLVVYDRLADEERTELQSMAQDASFYGVLASPSSVKAIDQETALLYHTLEQPGTIPTYVRQKFGNNTNEAIARLVLDEVLEIESKGAFVTGAAAHSIIYETASAEAKIRHPLVRLSESALRYAQSLPPLPMPQLIQRIYGYNMIPISVEWERRLPDKSAIKEWLGVGDWMNYAWHSVDTATDHQGWFYWQHRHSTAKALPYKLYISPHPLQFPEVFKSIVEIMGQYQVPSFKVGNSVSGILRSDKMVAYLPDFEMLMVVARALQPILTDYEAQGVPFTAPIDTAGMVSWGMDPPDFVQEFGDRERESWRYWIAKQLAAALSTAKSTDIAIEPWQFALNRLQIEGVSTEHWTPSQSIWNQI